MENVSAQMPDGSWVPAKQEPYYPGLITRIKCWLGFHELYISKKYRGTKVCFVCGKRVVGLKHY
jgi:hypothetical protein